MATIVGVLAEAALTIIYILFTDHFDSLISNVVSSISITDRYTNFTLGILDVSALIYYLSVSFLFVYVTIQRIQKKRYN
jgi:ABC-2 type transport system permease protein